MGINFPSNFCLFFLLTLCIFILVYKESGKKNYQRFKTNCILIYLSISLSKRMKRYKVQQVLDLLKKDGWILVNWTGDHRQLKHPEKKSKVTVRGKPSDTLSQFELNSIWKQAGWK